MAQRHQAGHALQQVQAHGKDGHDHHARDHLRVEVAAHEGEGDQRHQAQRQHDLDAARQGFEVGFGCAHCLNKPSGFHSSTAAISM
jgi:hypothetical protein